MSTRIINTKRNIMSGAVMQVLNIILPFASRTIILYLLGAEYQGLSGLFTSILQVLNLADLGFSSAVVFVLYKPVAENDHEQVCALLAYLRENYQRIGLVIFTCGICILPFMKHLINGSLPADVNVYVLFVIYLINSSSSYMLFSYYNVLFSAMQRTDISNNIASISNLVVRAIQILALLRIKSYYAFVIIIPLGTLISNVLTYKAVVKYYPTYKPEGILADKTKKTIQKQIRAIFIDRLSDIARNSFDNIMISSLIGLTMVAIYDNYYYIFSALYGLLAVLRKGMQGSVGSSIVKETVEKNYGDLKKFTFIMMSIVSWISICMLCLYQPFMMIWMKGNAELLLKPVNMFLFCVYFYLINMSHIRNLYLDGNGLFWECRTWYIVEAASNLILNFALGRLMGVTGILVATIVTILLFNFITRTNIVFHCYFRRSPKEYYVQHIINILYTMIAAAISFALCDNIPIVGLCGLIIRGIVCNVVFVVVFFAFYARSTILIESIAFIKLLRRKA